METTLLLVISTLIFLAVGLLVGYLVWGKKASSLELSSQEKRNLQTELGSLKLHLDHLQNQISDQEKRESQRQRELAEKSSLLGKLEAEKTSLEERMSAQKGEIKEMKEQFQKDFENLANRIFDEKSEKFTIQSRQSLDRIIDPLKERIKEFQLKVESTHTSSIKETTSLRQELIHLKEMNQKMSLEAENLTKALKNDSKTQGNWGEMILETILEGSGLQKDRQYFVQKSFKAEDGKRLQPDVTVKLPDDKWIIVDSKVSLTAYERYNSADNEETEAAFLKEHLSSIRNHVGSLSSKSYQDILSGDGLDFILMFVPIEPAYLLALNKDQGLFNEAYQKGIVMVSPSTLIASLKIIAATWKHEYQNKNAIDIANRGKLLLEKFIGFAEDFEKIGEQIQRTDNLYSDAMKKLRDGKGNLVHQARQLEELGVKSAKKLSTTYSISDED